MISKEVEQLSDGRYIVWSYKPPDGYNKFDIKNDIFVMRLVFLLGQLRYLERRLLAECKEFFVDMILMIQKRNSIEDDIEKGMKNKKMKNKNEKIKLSQKICDALKKIY